MGIDIHSANFLSHAHFLGSPRGLGVGVGQGRAGECGEYEEEEDEKACRMIARKHRMGFSFDVGSCSADLV